MKFFKKGEHYQVKIFEKEVITRMGDEKQLPYLVRFTVLRTPWFQILLHKFLISDDDCLHDHPWPFWTFIIWGGYYEWSVLSQYAHKQVPGEGLYMMKLGYDNEVHVKRRMNPGKLLYRPATWKHRVELIHGRPAYTLVVTTKPIRGWGFWTKLGYVPHRQYSSQTRCD